MPWACSLSPYLHFWPLCSTYKELLKLSHPPDRFYRLWSMHLSTAYSNIFSVLSVLFSLIKWILWYFTFSTLQSLLAGDWIPLELCLFLISSMLCPSRLVFMSQYRKEEPICECCATIKKQNVISSSSCGWLRRGATLYKDEFEC